MELNNTQHKSFLWYLDFEPFAWHTFYGEQCPPFVTEENKEAWRRYLEKLIKKHLKAEVMDTPEFREIETMVNYEKLVRIKNDEQRKRYHLILSLSEPIFRTWHFFWRLKRRR